MYHVPYVKSFAFKRQILATWLHRHVPGGWFNLQGQYMPLLWAAYGLTHPFMLLARRCVHHRFDFWPAGSYLAASHTMCSLNITTHLLQLPRYHVRNPRSHRHLRHVQHTPFQLAAKCCQGVANHCWLLNPVVVAHRANMVHVRSFCTNLSASR